jgi:predicted TIM-barrel fold metal-dependent hydrolase
MGDNSDRLIETMDRYGVAHALISSAGATTNEVIGDAAKKHKGKLFPLYRPWIQQAAMWTGKMTFTDPKELAANREQIVTDIRSLFPKFGFIGLAEFTPGVVTMEVNPIRISRDLGPIMEALQEQRAAISFATGSSAFKGNLYYLYDVLWVDEVAGNFPKVPIVLTKIGRGFQSCFDMCLVVAMRNANVFLDLTDCPGEHVRKTINAVGARRVMFGTDLHVISQNYAYDVGAEIVRDAKLSDEEWEWVAWRTANEAFKLGLK